MQIKQSNKVIKILSFFYFHYLEMPFNWKETAFKYSEYTV